MDYGQSSEKGGAAPKKARKKPKNRSFSEKGNQRGNGGPLDICQEERVGWVSVGGKRRGEH